jgi:arylsulfatase A-like enzyme
MSRSLLRARWPWLVAVFLILAAYASTWFEIRSGDPRPVGSATHIRLFERFGDTNVLFVLIDTLRSHRVGCYGYERDTTPTLDYMAQTGVRFARHLAQSSWTKCSMASLWTGLNPARSRVLRSEHAAPPEATMPAEILREAGFRTAGIWRNGWVAPNFGFDQGFEIYERPPPRRSPVAVRRENPHLTLEGTDHDVVDTAIEFLRVHGRERWFLYVHLMDVHQYLYDEASALFGSSYSDVYDNSIRHTDAVVGRLLTHLAEADLLQKTLVVISSDHGEAFGERGFEGHARQVYRESTEVPFILGFPFRLEPGLVLETRTRNVDVWPTILDLLGLTPLPDTDGRSLVPLLLAAAKGEAVTDDPRPAFAHIDRTWGQRGSEPSPLVAVAQDGFRFVYGPESNGSAREELFDSSTDALERRNVRREHPEVAARMRDLARRYLESAPPAPWGVETPVVELDEMEFKQLRALGYAVP